MLLSELEFASFLTYSTKGTSAEAGESRRWMRNLKENKQVGDPSRPTALFVAQRLLARLHESC